MRCLGNLSIMNLINGLKIMYLKKLFISLLIININLFIDITKIANSL